MSVCNVFFELSSWISPSLAGSLVLSLCMCIFVGASVGLFGLCWKEMAADISFTAWWWIFILVLIWIWFEIILLNCNVKIVVDWSRCSVIDNTRLRWVMGRAFYTRTGRCSNQTVPNYTPGIDWLWFHMLSHALSTIWLQFTCAKPYPRYSLARRMGLPVALAFLMLLTSS